MIFFGHKKQWDFFKRKLELNQLSHAYLFVGQEKIGKKIFAKELIKFIGCQARKGGAIESPCQKCFSCKIVEKEVSPDFRIITKKPDKTEIEISQIREIQEFLKYKPYYDNFKAVIIDNAERMNSAAQSCFLKTLEEPAGKTLLILITSKPDMLLPTIISRCQVVRFFRPKDLPKAIEETEKEQKILKEILSVIDSNLANKFNYVRSIDFEKQNAEEILEIMEKHFRNLLLSRSKKYSFEKIKNAINLIEDINQKLFFTNVNPKLALEILLMEI